MTAAVLQAFLIEHQLPASFDDVWRRMCEPLAERALRLRDGRGRTVVVGLCGAQGSGKSTLAAAIVEILGAQGMAAVSLSLDDLYLGRSQRAELAARVHPLLATRGPPGTHDVNLGVATFDGLRGRGAVALPTFDKAIDEPRPQSDWRNVRAPLDVVFFEGWCVGARPESADRLSRPINSLEADEDAGGVWRRFVNSELAGPYQELFARLDDLVLLQAPSFEVVLGWRTEQEHKLIARAGRGMTDAELGRFVQHYERLTRWILEEMPARAGLTIPLGPDRAPL